MQFFVLILLFSAIFPNCFGEKENDPPLPPQIARADERCSTLSCTKGASFKDEKVRKTLLQKFCPSASATEMAAANGWCVTQLITPEMITGAMGQLGFTNNNGTTASPQAMNAVLAKMKMFYRLSDNGFWMLMYVPNCAELMNNVANNVPSIVHHVIR
ncbi:hypothetical protein niasHT_008510 [Heterodera trifolii]|uniref:Uncharacterized protein n=1 Tax=Heterodera trifolii TaxID=157864 RepID=A0ABD2M3U6_9BILA